MDSATVTFLALHVNDRIMHAFTQYSTSADEELDTMKLARLKHEFKSWKYI